MDGLVVLDKPAGCTSHDVVARCRRVFAQRGVGHGGTLDPDATGVLLVGLGRATRLLRYVSGHDKDYSAEVVLGVATTSLDASGVVTGRWDMAHVSSDAVRAAAAKLTGTIEQIPPMVSALHVGGRRLHELAREGLEVERAARTVVVRRFDVKLRSEPGASGVGDEIICDIEVTCSSGTYVRTLAADLGSLLGGGAHLRRLRRGAVGPFGIAEACALDEVSVENVLTPAQALRGMPVVQIDADVASWVAHGKVLRREVLGVTDTGPWAIISDGELRAVYEPHGTDLVKPSVVLAAAGQ